MLVNIMLGCIIFAPRSVGAEKGRTLRHLQYPGSTSGPPSGILQCLGTMGISAFKDRLAPRVDFPIGITHLEAMLPGVPFAAYFISTSTRLRQAFSLNAERLPVFRLQREVPLLRVMNDFILPEARNQSAHLIVYAIPTARKRTAKAALERFDLAALERDFPEAMVYHGPTDNLEIEAGLPNWF